MKNKKIIFRPASEITQQVTPSPKPLKNEIPKWYKNLKRYYENKSFNNFSSVSNPFSSKI
jgi:hypothetical protein